MHHVLQRYSIVAVGLACLALFGALEMQQPRAVRSSFTLVGLIDCGQRSGRACADSATITLISDDSGSKQPYVINLSWVKDKLSDELEQDQQVRIEIERLPDGTLMALRVIDLNDRKGTQRDDEGPRPTSTDDDEDKEDDTVEIFGGETCVPATTTVALGTTSTRTSTTDSTFTTTETTTVTTTTVTTSTSTGFTFGNVTTGNTQTSTSTLGCGTVTVTATSTATTDTTTTDVTSTTATSTHTVTTTATTVTTTGDFCRVPLGTPDGEEVSSCAGSPSSGPSWLESFAPAWQPVAGWWSDRIAAAPTGVEAAIR